MLNPIPSLNSIIDLRLDSTPKISDPVIYEALFEIHSAIEKLVRQYDGTNEDILTTLTNILAFISQQKAIKTITTSYVVLSTDGTILVDASTSSITVTLPSALNLLGTVFNVKCIDNTNAVIVVGASGSETIDTFSTGIELDLYDSISVKSDGSDWWII
jgi:hypothetical protein